MAQTVRTCIGSVMKSSSYSLSRKQIDSTRSKDEITHRGVTEETDCVLSKKLDNGGGSTPSVDNSVHKSFTNACCPYTDACTDQIAYSLGIAGARHSTPISCGGLPLHAPNPQLVKMS